MAGMLSYAMKFSVPDYEQSPQYRDGRFHNVVPRPERSFLEGMRLWRDFFFDKPAGHCAGSRGPGADAHAGSPAGGS